MRKKLIGVFLILLAALILLQGYFVKWDISIWTLAWVTLLAVLSLSSFLKRHFGWGFIYGLLALFCLNGQYHFLPVSNSVITIIRRLAPSKPFLPMPIAGIEPVTYALRVRCSTN